MMVPSRSTTNGGTLLVFSLATPSFPGHFEPIAPYKIFRTTGVSQECDQSKTLPVLRL